MRVTTSAPLSLIDVLLVQHKFEKWKLVTPHIRERLDTSQMGMSRTHGWTTEPFTEPWKGHVGDHDPLGARKGSHNFPKHVDLPETPRRHAVRLTTVQGHFKFPTQKGFLL